ncbi:hypothetical protein ACWDBP_43450 [Streptomyces sp. NPDC001233]
MPQRARRAMKGLRSVGAAQRFLAAFSRISSHLRSRRRLTTASDYRFDMAERFRVWKTITGAAATA